MEDEVRITLRIPKVVHDALVALAKREDRSLNGQIIRLLRQALGLSSPS